MEYLFAFLTGGIICLIGQILIDRTSLTPARILTGFVLAGVVLTALGLYEPIVKFGGAGATVPICGFGYLMANGVKEAIDTTGIMGILSGSWTSAAVGMSSAIFFGLLAGLIFKPSDKS